MMEKSKIIKIQDVQAGRLVEREFDLSTYDPIGELMENVYRTRYSQAFAERFSQAGYGSTRLLEAFVVTPDANIMLRDGVRFMSMLAYQEAPQTFQAFADVVPSNRPQEEWLRDATIGTIPATRSGVQAPQLLSGFEGGVKLVNTRYAGLVSVTGDDIRFDRLGKIRQIAPELGMAARRTEEQTVYTDITTTGNYVRNSTTNDNDVGANTATATFSASTLVTGLTTITTAKDRKSGAYLGFMPDTLICGPRLEFAAKQLLLTDQVQRVGAASANDVYGTGTVNSFRGIIKNIVVTPWIAGTKAFAWALTDSTRRGYKFQQVEPFNVYQEAQDPSSEAWLTRDETRFLVQGYFGTGFADDRMWYYSDSNTAPASA